MRVLIVVLLSLSACRGISYVPVPVASQKPAVLPIDDSQVGCHPARRADRYQRDLTIDETSFGERELCDNSHPHKRLLNVLWYLESLQFAPPAQDNESPWIAGFVEDNYYAYVAGHMAASSIRLVYDRKANNNAHGHRTGFTLGYQSGGDGIVAITPLWAGYPLIQRLGTIVHEARHTAPTPSMHDSVKYGTAGDRSFFDGGAYAVEVEFYAKMMLRAINIDLPGRLIAERAFQNSRRFDKAPALKTVIEVASLVKLMDRDAFVDLAIQTRGFHLLSFMPVYWQFTWLYKTELLTREYDGKRIWEVARSNGNPDIADILRSPLYNDF